MKNLLIVEDSKTISNALLKLADKHQYYKVYIAESLKEATEYIEDKEIKFFTAILDLNLPDAPDGEIVDYIISKDIIPIILTGTIDNSLRDKILKKTIVDYLIKESYHDLENTINLAEKLLYLQNQKALIVDDSRLVRNHVAHFFNTLYIDSLQAKDPKEAIEILNREKNIKIVTLDYNMPIMNGAELTKKIRRKYSNDELITIGITGELSEEVKYQFLKNGANDFLTKPIIKEEFNTKILNHLSNIKMLDETRLHLDLMNRYIITSRTNKKGIITEVSDAFCKISGYTEEELVGKPQSIVRHPDMPKQTFKELWDTIQSGKIWSGEIKNRAKDGTEYWTHSTIEPIFLDNSKQEIDDIIAYSSIRIDITDKKRIEKISITDGLTNLYNRRYFNMTLPEKLDESKNKNSYIGFIIFDVDHFKQYNDTYGHQAGDDVLIALGSTIKKSTGEGNIAFRLGGEEFGVIFFDLDKKQSLEYANGIKDNIENLKIKHEKNSASDFITASMGLILLKDEYLDIDEIYKKADEALYFAKENGRNQVKIVD